MIASLGMYDRRETVEANDRFWALIRNALRQNSVAAPENLTRGSGAYWDAWRSKKLVLSQTCGFPYRAFLHDKVDLVGTPDYGVANCPPGYYCSVFIVRKGDPRTELSAFRTASFAYNEELSQSGWAAPQNNASSLGFQFKAGLRTEGHLHSALAVAESRADIAAIDAVTWGMIQTWEPAAIALREVARTPPTPGLPYIAARGSNRIAIFSAVNIAISQLEPEDKKVLRLKGLVYIDPLAYLEVPVPQMPTDATLDEVLQQFL